MSVEYYVTLNDELVEGPFRTREAASRRAAELTTNEVGLHYRVKSNPATSD